MSSPRIPLRRIRVDEYGCVVYTDFEQTVLVLLLLSFISAWRVI